MKRILITGGAGFLGSHLCDKLLGEGNEILFVDNLFTGRRSNIHHLLDNKNFEFLRHDVTFPLYAEVDEIYNLACPASPVHYQLDPVQTTKTSVIGAINMLGLAKRLKIKILQASTSEVYGDPEVHPQPESYKGSVSVIGPRACYDEGKRAADAGRGAGDEDGGVAERFHRAKGGPLNHDRGGFQTRPYRMISLRSRRTRARTCGRDGRRRPSSSAAGTGGTSGRRARCGAPP